MPFPPQIKTRTVTLGGAMSMENAEPLPLAVTVTSSRSLVWSDSGYWFRDAGVTVTASAGGEVMFTLPVTDLQGWRDPATNELIDVSADESFSHTYTAHVEIGDPSLGPVESLTVGPFPLPYGDGSPVDLDKTVPAVTSAGERVSIPDVWSRQVAAAQASAAAAADSARAAADAITGADGAAASAGASALAAKAAETAAASSAQDAATRAAAASTSATNASQDAASAAASAGQASTARASAQTHAGNAGTRAAAAATSADAADQRATAAAASATAADGSREAAVAARDTAVDARAGSEAARDTAVTAKTAAETAKGLAETARTGAEAARTASETAQAGTVVAKEGAIAAQTGAETARTGAELALSGAATARTGAESAKTAAEIARDQALAGQMLGTSITTPVDLNTFQTPGRWRFSGSAISSANLPVAKPGVLDVRYITGSTNVQQEYRPFSSVAADRVGFYQREAANSSTVWDAWQAFTPMRTDVSVGRRIFAWDMPNAREQMVYGDTGWRNVTTDILNGWAASSIVMRRVGSLVQVRIEGLNSSARTSITVLNMPTGFRGATDRFLMFDAPGGAVATYRGVIAAGIDIVAPTTAALLYGGGSFLTNDPWPTALPGAASGSIPSN